MPAAGTYRWAAWNVWRFVAAPWLSTSVVDVVITRGRTMNDKATTILSTQPHTANPDADKAGLCASTASV